MGGHWWRNRQRVTNRYVPSSDSGGSNPPLYPWFLCIYNTLSELVPISININCHCWDSPIRECLSHVVKHSVCFIIYVGYTIHKKVPEIFFNLHNLSWYIRTAKHQRTSILSQFIVNINLILPSRL